MIVRKFLAFLFIPALFVPGVVLGQAHDASVANHQPHYYDVADWDIQPSDVTYADHIAPVLQRSCVQCHDPEVVGRCRLRPSKKYVHGHL